MMTPIARVAQPLGIALLGVLALTAGWLLGLAG